MKHDWLRAGWFGSVAFCFWAVATLPALAAPQAKAPATFQIEEATISQVHAAMKAKQLTCRDLVAQYLKRIDADDKQDPALNAIVQINPDALKEADALDRRFAQSGLTGPLHCVPAIVKDNFETIGLQSADGSLSLQGFVSNKDAFLVKRIKAAGAIVIAKSNMGEFAFSPLETVNSILGTTKNPYALDRVPAGSSGGTAAAIASNFGLIGLGSDTGNSIRGPSAHNALVGIRSTMGLTSRAGVIPLSYLADIAGPMTRTVEDAVAVFQVIVGEDPDDPMTARSRGRAIPNYAASLVRDGLKGARIGVLHQAYERANLPVDDEVAKVFAKALDDLKAAGAEIVDPAPVDLRRGPPRPGRRTHAADSSTTSTSTWRSRAIACRCTTSRKSSHRASFTSRFEAGSNSPSAARLRVLKATPARRMPPTAKRSAPP